MSSLDEAGWQSFGASVRGPEHIRLGLPNQDAWRTRHTRAGSVVVVCDGLGSRPHADVGSRAACRAVMDAAGHWHDVREVHVRRRLQLVHLLWLHRLDGYAPEDCATTCLFAHVRPDGSLFAAQLGDGMVVLDEPHKPLRFVGAGPGEGTKTSFSNLTDALGTPHVGDGWQWLETPPLCPGTRLMLATDGIVDDLLEDGVAGFVNYVHHTFADMPPRTRWRRLARELRDWPVPHHLDDKTLAMLWLPPHAVPNPVNHA